MRTRVMVIDRRPVECAALAKSLSGAGYQPVIVDDCHHALEAARRNRPAIILVGRLSADIFRDDYCQHLRDIAPAGTMAIVALLPGATRLTRIRCLEAGADDVLDQDIPAARLIARLDALCAQLSGAGDAILKYGPLEMHIDQYKVRACGTPIEMSKTTFEILRSFLERPEQIISRTDLLATCNAIGTYRSLSEHVRRLKRAMARLGIANSIITVPPTGYMLSMRNG